MAKPMIQEGNGESTKMGIELLLTHDISADGGEASVDLGRADAAHLLERGLSILQSMPFQALGVPYDCTSADVRKAFKKLALKYHPDKNPRTTPLFVVMKAASDKLADDEERKRAADFAQRTPMPTPRPDNTSYSAANANARNSHASNANNAYTANTNTAKPSNANDTGHTNSGPSNSTAYSNANNTNSSGANTSANRGSNAYQSAYPNSYDSNGQNQNGGYYTQQNTPRDTNAGYYTQQNTPRYSDLHDDTERARRRAERQAEADRKAKEFAEKTRAQRFTEANMRSEAFFDEHERVRKEESDRRQKQREEAQKQREEILAQKLEREKERERAAQVNVC